MFVVSWTFELSFLEWSLLSFSHDWLTNAMISHRPDSLLLEILFDLSVVNSVDSCRPPSFLEFFIYGEICSPIVVEENLLFVNWAGYENDFGCSMLQNLFAMWK